MSSRRSRSSWGSLKMAAKPKTIKVGPQPGPQTDFLACEADIAFYGGSAGGGKSYALLLDPLRHFHNPRFGGVIFRRTTKQIRNEGGLWDTAKELYVPLGGAPLETLDITFKSGMRMSFAHLEHEKDVFGWQGAQVAYLGFDEVTHFTQKQFFYMISRLRSTSGAKGRVRATCNPDADSWVRGFIDWWIGEDGLPIPARAGKLRWFVRINDKLVWASSKGELERQYGADCMPKSVTFIPSKLSDNKILCSKDPGYLANLKALSAVERARLLDGNWNIRATAGTVFRREWFEIVDAAPAGCEAIRYWDRAATEIKEEERNEKRADWTAGLKLLKAKDGTFYVEDVVHVQYSPGKVETAVKNTAVQDGRACQIGIEQDPGSAGVADALNYTKLLVGYDVRLYRPSTDKKTRALPVSAQCEAGNVKLVRGRWNEDFLKELENFPDGANDDQVDGLSGAFNALLGIVVGEFTKEMAKGSKARPLAGRLKW